MQDVLTNVFSNNITHNGYVTVNTGSQLDRCQEKINPLNQIINSGSHMLNRLDERNYYTNGSGTI